MLGYLPVASLRPIVRSHPRLANLRTSPARWRAKLKVSVINIGRHSTKDAVFDSVIDEYVKRLRPVLDLDMRWVKPEAAVATVLDAASSGVSVLCLDADGKIPESSEHFTELLYSRLESGGSRLYFVVGDADGLPDDLKPNKIQPQKRRPATIEHLSLSRLTLTHKMVGHVLQCKLQCNTICP
jgi:23S rRNA pseudoU1915 N3-methylase RlmH